jgi:transcriptional regulator with GAF, ATPase, and Fis domain
VDRFLPLLIDIWRHAAGHRRLDEAVAGMAELVRHRIPWHRLLILQRDADFRSFRVAASLGHGQRLPEPTACSEDEMQALLAWCQGETVLMGAAQEVAGRLPGLFTADWTGDTLAVGLALEGDPLGALVLGAPSSESFTSTHSNLMLALREPLAVSLRNDLQLRELVSLREAAEADRRSLLSRLGRQDITDTMIGASSGLKDVMGGVELVARSRAPVLILGETGSGKEVVARAIHAQSTLSEGPFLRVNCGAIPPDLIDSELFGHERGSFTGAAARRKGWFERADGGTLFLDEIGELSPAVQVRLLRILQDGTFERVGGQQQMHVQVRVIAATHRDLHAMVAEGSFREDLWYRINVFPIHLPALRERPEDIPAMATHFALRAAERLGLTPRLPTAADLDRLIAYSWPGNVRELAAVIERAAILGDGYRLDVEHALGTGLPPPVRRNPAAATPVVSPVETIEVVTRRHIEHALAHTIGRIEGPFGAARLLGINPQTLRSRMRKLGIEGRAFRTTRRDPSP